MKHVVLEIFIVAVSCAHAVAQTDTTFSFQGELKDGAVLANGSYDLDFSLWNAAAAGSQIGSTVSLLGVVVADGRFTVQLDFGAAAFDNSDRWLEIDVDGVTLSPRTPVTRAPYSIQTRGIFVNDAAMIGIGTMTPIDELHVRGDGATLRLEDDDDPGSYTWLNDVAPSQAVLEKFNNSGNVLLDVSPRPLDGTSLGWIRFFRGTNTSGSKAALFYRGNNTTQVSALIGVDGADSFLQAHGGNIGIGTTTPSYKLHVEGGSDDAILGNSTGIGVRGIGSTGVYGETGSSSGEAVYGFASHTSGFNTGVFGGSSSTNGSGISGRAYGGSGTNYGVYGQTDSTDGYGVYGIALSSLNDGENTGVHGRTLSTDGIGTAGWASAFTGTTDGVYGQSDSVSGRGVYGRATNPNGTNYGVRGASNSSSGFDFYASGAGTDWGSSSSRRWKRNIERIDDPLYKLSKLRGVTFDWIEEHGGHRDIGFIAEEVGAVLPEIVQYEENGVDAIGMDYSKLTPLLVEAVNALRSESDRRIAELESANRALVEKNTELEARLAALEALVSQPEAAGVR